MRRRISFTSAAFCGALALLMPAFAGATALARPSIARIDAEARARGNRRALAVAIGERLFVHVLPVQLLEIRATGLDDRVYVGLRFSGKSFHGPVSRAALDRELLDAVESSFAVSARVQEVDCWIVVPIPVAAGTVVSGDKAMPTERDVLTLSVRRGESATHLAQRLKDGEGVVVDSEWIAHALSSKGTHA